MSMSDDQCATHVGPLHAYGQDTEDGISSERVVRKRSLKTKLNRKKEG